MDTITTKPLPLVLAAGLEVSHDPMGMHWELGIASTTTTVRNRELGTALFPHGHIWLFQLLLAPFILLVG